MEKEKSEGQEKESYLITEDQHQTLLDQYFQIQGTISILKAAAAGTHATECDCGFALCVENLTDLLAEKLENYGNLLDSVNFEKSKQKGRSQ